MTEQAQLWTALGAGLLAAIGGPPAVKALFRWIGKRIERREAREEREQQREATTVQELFEMVRRDRERLALVEKHAEDCHEALSEQHALNGRLISAADTLNQRVANTEARTSDMTGRFAIAAERAVRKTLSQQNMPPVREVRRPTSAEPEVVRRVPKRKEPDDE